MNRPARRARRAVGGPPDPGDWAALGVICGALAGLPAGPFGVILGAVIGYVQGLHRGCKRREQWKKRQRASGRRVE